MREEAVSPQVSGPKPGSMIGLLSDLLRPAAGAESLRWALVCVGALTPWPIWHYWRAGVLLKRREQAG